MKKESKKILPVWAWILIALVFILVLINQHYQQVYSKENLIAEKVLLNQKYIFSKLGCEDNCIYLNQTKVRTTNPRIVCECHNIKLSSFNNSELLEEEERINKILEGDGWVSDSPYDKFYSSSARFKGELIISASNYNHETYVSRSSPVLTLTLEYMTPSNNANWEINDALF